MSKSKAHKSWHEKLEHPPEGLPKVVDIPPNWEKRMGGKRILVPTPLMANEVIRTVPKGKLITTNQIRQILAKPFRADSACPLTLGIFLRIISEAAEEDRQAGKSRITPYWRVVKDNGSLNPKYPGGVDAQAKLLREEGHKIVAGKGQKPPKVVDFEKAVV
jgi:alkylated DNA nucleotide flippase Atl1